MKFVINMEYEIDDLRFTDRGKRLLVIRMTEAIDREIDGFLFRQVASSGFIGFLPEDGENEAG